MTPHLSIVIPAYNEEERIAATLQNIHVFVIAQHYASEVIVVNDGSCDQTSHMVHTFANTHPYVRLVNLPANQGKGAAVRAGMLAACGTYRLFADADNSTTITHATDLLAVAEIGADVVVGSRHVPGSRIITKQHVVREVLGYTFRALIRVGAPTGVRDTQNGFKLFTASAAELLFGEIQCPRWAFDVEVLRRARNHDLTIVEVPVTWVNDSRSKMRYTHMAPMLFDAVSIAYRTRNRTRT